MISLQRQNNKYIIIFICIIYITTFLQDTCLALAPKPHRIVEYTTPGRLSKNKIPTVHFATYEVSGLAPKSHVADVAGVVSLSAHRDGKEQRQFNRLYLIAKLTLAGYPLEFINLNYSCHE